MEHNVRFSMSSVCVVAGLHFHVVGEGVVRLHSARQERIYDRENYIDFRMRLLGEPGKCASWRLLWTLTYFVICKGGNVHRRSWGVKSAEVDIGPYGGEGDSGTLHKSNLGKLLRNGECYPPPTRQVG